MGIYPLLENGNCCFLVFDFDHHDELSTCDWRAEVEALRKVCNILGVDALVNDLDLVKGLMYGFFLKKKYRPLKRACSARVC